MLKALLIDVDGTLAETERFGHRPAYNRAFRTLGLGFRWTSDLYRTLLREPGGRERLQHYVRHYRPDLGAHAKAVQADIRAWADEVHRLKTQYFREYVQRGRVPLRTGVRRLLMDASARGVKIALVSNASRRSLDSVLRYALGPELCKAIDLIIDGDHVERKKPSPDPYLMAMHRLRVRPQDCVALEDSAEGLRATTSAQIRTVITVNSDTRHHDFSAATLVVSHLGDPKQPSQVLRGTMPEPYVTVDLLSRLVVTPAKAA